jgi:hypothetical protein
LETARIERERIRAERLKQREERPHPLRTFFGSLFGFFGSVFAPVFAWWEFVGMIPVLAYLSFGLVVLLVLLEVFKVCFK